MMTEKCRREERRRERELGKRRKGENIDRKCKETER